MKTLSPTVLAKRIVVVVLGTGFTIPTLLLVGCPADVGERCAESACFRADGSGNGKDGLGNGDGPVEQDVFVPPGCDYAADPKDSLACVVDDGGIFVDATGGNDSNLGTKGSPKQTIGAAVGALGNGKARVFVCGEGPYAEKIKIASLNASIFGGFQCGSWTYGGAKAKVVPNDKGYVLEVDGIVSASKVILADLELVAKDGSESGESSVAVFAKGTATGVILRRMKIQAGIGKDDSSPVGAPASNHFAGATIGNGASGGGGAGSKTCVCITSGRSAGGGGGANGDPTAGAGLPGSAMPAVTIMPPRTSLGGDGYTMATGACTFGKGGSDGSGQAGGTGAEGHGEITAAGFVGKPGNAGASGNPGAGGGGGGGGTASGGGGGGCGGCGGTGGLPGLAGGSSIAVLALDTPIITEAGELITGVAGTGGTGGTGQAGQPGGELGGAGGADGCSGGRGGNGAGGGAGGGGAGGVSVGVLFKGPAPTIDPTTTPNLGALGGGGAPGSPGIGGTNALGTGPSGGAATKGKDGVKGLMLGL
jgi:hypothetical protein